MDLLCRTSAEFLRELAETDIGGGGGRVLASFVRGVYRAPGSRWVGDFCKVASFCFFKLVSWAFAQGRVRLSVGSFDVRENNVFSVWGLRCGVLFADWGPSREDLGR